MAFPIPCTYISCRKSPGNARPSDGNLRFLRVFRAAACLLTTLLLSSPVSLLHAQNPSRDEVLSHLADMRRGQRGMMNVVPDEGRYLHDLILKHKVKNVLEVGTSNGYSGIWMGLALRETGGNLTTLEIDQGRANLARENFRRTGLDSRIHLVLGDALKSLTRLDGTFDFVFIDAAKSEYVQYLELLLPRVSPGGIIVAHNVDSHRGQLRAYLANVNNHPQLATTMQSYGPGGFSVSIKRDSP